MMGHKKGLREGEASSMQGAVRNSYKEEEV